MDKGTLIIGGFTIVALAGIILAATQMGPTSPQAAPGSQPVETDIAGVETFSNLSRTHTQADVTYEQTPPVGGRHRPVWLNCNGTAYESPVENERAVHGLEHGAVWITYDESVASSSVDQLEDKLSRYTFLSPYPEQGAPIKLSAWGNQLAVQSADDPRIDQFLDTFRQGPQTPEPGASCDAPTGAMNR